MPRYLVTATVSVDVEIEIDADGPDLARAALNDHLIMTASLVDFPAENFAVNEDSISDVTRVEIRKAAA